MQSKEYYQLKYGKHKGFYKWDLALVFFQTPNDTFFNMYGFNFVPQGELFDEAKNYLATEETGDDIIKQLQFEDRLYEAIANRDMATIGKSVDELLYRLNKAEFEVRAVTSQLHDLWKNNSSDEAKALIWEMERKEYIRK